LLDIALNALSGTVSTRNCNGLLCIWLFASANLDWTPELSEYVDVNLSTVSLEIPEPGLIKLTKIKPIEIATTVVTMYVIIV